MVAAERVTVFEGAAPMFAAMLGPPPATNLDFGSLRVCISAAAAMPVEVLRRFEDKFNCTVLEGYGLPETSGPACFNHPNALRKIGSARHAHRRRADAGDRRTRHPGAGRRQPERFRSAATT